MISTVSIVGVDDSLSPSELVDISNSYPFVEWGLNLSSNTDPKPSFPSDEWLDQLLNYEDKLRLRGILHGRWQRDILDGIISLKAEKPRIWNALNRIQVDIRHGVNKLIESLQIIHDKEAILRADNPKKIPRLGKLNAHPLLPQDSIFKHTQYCGYILKEDDIDLILVETDQVFWISIEDTGSIDLFKVERLLDMVEDSVTHDSLFKALLETGDIKRRFSHIPERHDEVEGRKI